MNPQYILPIAIFIFVAVILFLTFRNPKKGNKDSQNNGFSPIIGDSTKKTKHVTSSSSKRRNRNDEFHNNHLTNAVWLDEITSNRSYGDSEHSSSNNSDSSIGGSSISSGSSDSGFSGGGDFGGGM